MRVNPEYLAAVNQKPFEYARHLRHDEAETLVRKIEREEKKLRRLGGNGNYSAVVSLPTWKLQDRTYYSVFVTPLAD